MPLLTKAQILALIISSASVFCSKATSWTINYFYYLLLLLLRAAEMFMIAVPWTSKWLLDASISRIRLPYSETQRWYKIEARYLWVCWIKHVLFTTVAESSIAADQFRNARWSDAFSLHPLCFHFHWNLPTHLLHCRYSSLAFIIFVIQFLLRKENKYEAVERKEKWMDRVNIAVAVAIQNGFPFIKGVIRCFMRDTRYETKHSKALRSSSDIFGFSMRLRITWSAVWPFGLVYHLFMTYLFTLLFLLLY